LTTLLVYVYCQNVFGFRHNSGQPDTRFYLLISC